VSKLPTTSAPAQPSPPKQARWRFWSRHPGDYSEESEVRLADRAVRGGAYIVRREGIGMLIRLAGVAVVVRLIGPSSYGIYSAALAFATVAVIMAQMGVEVHLIRQGVEPAQEDYDRAFTFLLFSSVTIALLGLAGTYAFGPWLRPVGVLLPLRVLLLCVPINVLWAPGQAMIERRFGFRQMGWLEIGGDLALYGTAVPLALLHAGAWSLIAGYFAWQGFLLFGSFAFSGYRPRLHWSTSSVVGFVKDGSSFAGAQGLERLGGVVNAMVVGTFAGAAGVGLVSFAMRLVDTIGFAARGTYRLGLVALSKVADSQHERLRFALEEGCLIQLLTLALPFIAFGLAAPWLVPLVFGHEWTAAIPIYAVLALATTLSAPSLIFSVFLLTRGRYVQVCISGAIAITILAGTAIPLVRWLGPVGFAWASVLALADTIYLDHYVRRTSQFSYRIPVTFALILGPAIVLPLLGRPYGFVALVPSVLLIIVPSLRSELLRIVALLRSARATT
jgi:O-antigen/teichoic acid export membrane protein